MNSVNSHLFMTTLLTFSQRVAHTVLALLALAASEDIFVLIVLWYGSCELAGNEKKRGRSGDWDFSYGL